MVLQGEVVSEGHPKVFERHWEFVGCEPTAEQLKIAVAILAYDGDDEPVWVTNLDG
jgi:hypothetical protein